MIMNNKIYSILIGVLIIGELLIKISIPLGFVNIVSIGTHFIVLASIIALIQILFSKKQIDLKILSLFFLIISILISIIYYGKVTYSTAISTGCFLEIPIFICAFNFEVGKKIKQSIYLCHIVLSVFYIIIFISPLAYLYTTKWGTIRIPELTLSYGNPNETAMYLLCTFIVLSSLLFKVQKKTMFFLLLVDLSIQLYMIWLTNSRTMIIVIIIFISSCLLIREKNIPKYYSNIAFIIPVIFVLFILNGYFQDTVIMGDLFDTGREDIYNRVIDNLNIVSFFIGDFSFKFQNLHNAIISIFGTIGIVGLFLYYYILISAVNQLKKNPKQTMENRIAYIGLLCLIIQTSTEAAFLTGGSAFAASFLSVYFSCSSECRESENNKY